MDYSYEKLYVEQSPISVKKFINHNSENHIHWHEEIELLYFTHGSAVTSCNFHEYRVKQGDIVFVNGKELHTGIVSGVESVFYCIHINTGFFSNLIGNEYVVFENIITDKSCSALLNEIIQKYTVEGFKNTIDIKRLMYSFFSIAADRHVKVKLGEAEYKRQFKKLDKFNIIIEYIDKHYDEELTVAALADKFFMSQSYFAHFFKSRAKKSVIQYINETRINHAKAFLEREDMSVGEIACQVGFGDINYFSRKFKAATGITPTEYRKQYIG